MFLWYLGSFLHFKVSLLDGRDDFEAARIELFDLNAVDLFGCLVDEGGAEVLTVVFGLVRFPLGRGIENGFVIVL